MLRTFLLAAGIALVGCHHDPKPMTPKEGELPPLPPASGTAVGYLVDNALTLKLRPDQLDKLEEIDTSLAARNDSIDTRLPLDGEARRGAHREGRSRRRATTTPPARR